MRSRIQTIEKERNNLQNIHKKKRLHNLHIRLWRRYLLMICFILKYQ